MKDGKAIKGIVLKAEETIRIPLRDYRMLVVAADRLTILRRDAEARKAGGLESYQHAVDHDFAERVLGVTYWEPEAEEAEEDDGSDMVKDALDQAVAELKDAREELLKLQQENQELKDAAQRLGYGYTKLTKE